MTSSHAPHVLVLGINYPPEHTGVSPYTGAMARGLAVRDFDVTVVTTHPHYPEWKVHSGYGGWSRRERLDGVDVERVRHYVPTKPQGVRRLLSEASFGARVSSRRWRRPDAIVAVSPALIASAMASARAQLTHRGTPLVVWVQDLYTVGMAETGRTSAAAVGAMRRIERWLLRRADKVVVIHQRFADRIAAEFGVPRDRIEVIRNWTHLGPQKPVDVAATRAAHGWQDDETIVLHAGNMGVKQGLENVVDTARLAAERGDRVRFVLLGTGSQLKSLEAAGRGIPNLQFIAPLGDADFAATLGSADLLLVNELAGVSEMAVPSKLTSYFASGRPVVAATDPTGITAQEVLTADAGIVVPAGDPDALLDAVRTLAEDHAERDRLGANGCRYREAVLGEGAAIDGLADLLQRVITGDTSGARPDASPFATPENDRGRIG